MAQLSNLLLKLSRELFPDRTEREMLVSALVHPRPIPIYYGVSRSSRYLNCARRWTGSPSLSIGWHRVSSLRSISYFSARTGSNSVFAWQLLQPKLLLANTLIRQHHRLLLGHLRRCGITPAAMMSVDSGVLAEVIPGTADLVIVDAPSSAQSVLARGRLNPGCFHPVTIAKYAKCQRRLLANASRLVAPQGYLLYTTRTYSLDENEHILDCPFRRTDSFPKTIFQTEAWGLGGFTTLLQNTTVGSTRSLSPHFLTQPRISQV